MPTVLKLGGSLVTAKTGREELAVDRLTAVAEAIGSTDPAGLIVVHGGGSFGHPVAAEYGVSQTAETRDPSAITAIGEAMERLNRAVVGALVDADVPAVSVATGSMTWLDGVGTVHVDIGAIASMMAEGFVPVARGDIVARLGSGFVVVSGDELAATLGNAVSADRIGFCANVPGVLDDEGNVVSAIGSYDEVEAHIESPDGTDVTGGMEAKIRTILDSEIPGAIFGPDEVQQFLRGELPGTRVEEDAGSF